MWNGSGWKRMPGALTNVSIHQNQNGWNFFNSYQIEAGQDMLQTGELHDNST